MSSGSKKEFLALHPVGSTRTAQLYNFENKVMENVIGQVLEISRSCIVLFKTEHGYLEIPASLLLIKKEEQV